MEAGRQIDPRRSTQPEQGAYLDRIVVVVDGPGAAPVLNSGLVSEQSGNIGSSEMTSRSEALGNFDADSAGQRNGLRLSVGGKKV